MPHPARFAMPGRTRESPSVRNSQLIKRPQPSRRLRGLDFLLIAFAFRPIYFFLGTPLKSRQVMVAFPASPMLDDGSEMELSAPRTSRSHAQSLKWIWALQGLVAVPRLFLIVFVTIVMLALYPVHHTPPGAILVWM